MQRKNEEENEERERAWLRRSWNQIVEKREQSRFAGETEKRNEQRRLNLPALIPYCETKKLENVFDCE